MDLRPPIAERSTELLIHMAADSEEWQPEAQALARMELERRGVDPTIVLTAQRNVANARTVTLRQRELNAQETYPFLTLAGLFIAAPFMVIAKLLLAKLHVPFRLGLTALDAGNYVRKYRQRMAMLVSGTLFWVLLLSVFT